MVSSIIYRLCEVLLTSAFRKQLKDFFTLVKKQKRNFWSLRGFLGLKLWQVEVTPENKLQAPVCASVSGKARPNEDDMFFPRFIPILLPSRSPADPRMCLWCRGQALAGWGHPLSPSTFPNSLSLSCCPSQLLGNDQNWPIIAPAKKYSSTRNKKSPPYCQSQSRQGKLRSLKIFP